MKQPRIHLNVSRQTRSKTSNNREQKSGRPSVRFGVIFLVAVAVLFFVWLCVSGTLKDFLTAVVSAKKNWLIAGACFFILYFLFDMACYRVAGMLAGTRLGLRDLLSVASVGIVFGYLTPGQSGAAPAQIVRLTQVGLKAGDATAVQLTKFFIYQLAVTFFGAVVLLTRVGYFVERFGDFVLISFFSFAIHLAIVAVLVALIFFPSFVRKFGHLLIKLCKPLGSHLRVFSDLDALHARLDAEIDSYTISIQHAVRQGKIVALTVAVNVFELMCLYCIPYCVLRALGVDSVSFLTSLCSAAFIQLIMTAIPLPGGTGGAEAGFSLFFAAELGAYTAAGVVLWRALSYYLPIVCSLPMLGLRSGLSPVDRYARFGDVHMGQDGLDDTIAVARMNKDLIIDKTEAQIDRVNFKAGRKPFVVIRGAQALAQSPLGAPISDSGAGSQTHRLRIVLTNSQSSERVRSDGKTNDED